MDRPKYWSRWKNVHTNLKKIFFWQKYLKKASKDLKQKTWSITVLLSELENQNAFHLFLYSQNLGHFLLQIFIIIPCLLKSLKYFTYWLLKLKII